MLVAMWFTMVGFVVIAGFVMVGLTLRHWAKEKKMANGKEAAAPQK